MTELTMRNLVSVTLTISHISWSSLTSVCVCVWHNTETVGQLLGVLRERWSCLSDVGKIPWQSLNFCSETVYYFVFEHLSHLITGTQFNIFLNIFYYRSGGLTWSNCTLDDLDMQVLCIFHPEPAQHYKTLQVKALPLQQILPLAMYL